MSIREERQEAARPVRFPNRSRRKVSSESRSSSIAVQPDCVVSRRERSVGKADATDHGGELAFAVYTAVQPACHSGRHFPVRRRSRRFAEEDVSDEMLLKGVADGDKAAMHIMFARHRARVFRFIHKVIRNPVIVDDIVSQVFLDVWRSASRFEQRARVSTWLLSIARFKAISFLKERKHESIDQDHVLAIVDDGDTPETAFDRKERSGTLRACLDELSPAHREIIQLFYYHDKSIAEVGEIVGIPLATVKSRMFYARKHLARILVNAGFEAAGIRA